MVGKCVGIFCGGPDESQEGVHRVAQCCYWTYVEVVDEPERKPAKNPGPETVQAQRRCRQEFGVCLFGCVCLQVAVLLCSPEASCLPLDVLYKYIMRKLESAVTPHIHQGRMGMYNSYAAMPHQVVVQVSDRNMGVTARTIIWSTPQSAPTLCRTCVSLYVGAIAWSPMLHIS